MVRIITDSAADFEHSESEKFGISTVPLAVYIDGKEYRCKVRSNLGNYGDKVELIYLPSEPEHVFSLKGAISFSEVVNYVLIGWILFWVFGKLFIDWIFDRFYEP